jgi:Pvc16 N-terminal domain
MIQDLDDTLKELLVKKMPIDLATIDIKFEMPDKDWETKLPARPTINLYLYDIRENHELRSNERFLARNGPTGTETNAPIRIDFAYLITAWTKEIADEHRLLGNLLKTLLRYPVLPADVLKGEMTTQSLPLRGWVAQPERTPNAWDFWGAIDGRVKASLSYMVTVAVQPSTPIEVRLVQEDGVKTDLYQATPKQMAQRNKKAEG